MTVWDSFTGEFLGAELPRETIHTSRCVNYDFVPSLLASATLAKSAIFHVRLGRAQTVIDRLGNLPLMVIARFISM